MYGQAGGVLEQLQLLDVDTVETRATQLLTNLGFSDELRARPMSALSGGWRVRTMLAAAIFGKPDMLLLDEPTNHLSIGGMRAHAHALWPPTSQSEAQV